MPAQELQDITIIKSQKEYEFFMVKLIQRIQQNRNIRIALVLSAGAVALIGAVYLYFHNPYSYPLPCIFYTITGLYCPGCGAGRACYSLLHLRFLDAFCYNPLMTLLLPLLGLYVAVRGVDWMLTGGNHVDGKISVRLLAWIFGITLLYGVLRNIPVFPFTLLTPGGLARIL